MTAAADCAQVPSDLGRASYSRGEYFALVGLYQHHFMVAAGITDDAPSAPLPVIPDVAEPETPVPDDLGRDTYTGAEVRATARLYAGVVSARQEKAASQAVPPAPC